MRNLRVIVMVLAIVGVSSLASASDFMEDFESYAAGSEMHGQGGWKGWDNDIAWGAPASDLYAFSGSTSVEIGGSADLVHEFDISGGRWELSVMQYIPSGTTGESFFILLNTYRDGGADDWDDWSVQTNFNLGTGAISPWHSGAGQIVYDQWVELKYIINLDNNTVDKYYNGELIGTDQWDDNVHGTLQCIDLFANNASEVYYDDITIMRPPRAYNPAPADGGINPQIWVSLGWSPGGYAVSHDVYLGENFDDVNDGTGETFRGNHPLTTTTFFIGISGYPYPDGLVPGTTYYWRIDEVNDLNPDSPWKGDVWSFLVPPMTSYAPTPADGAKFIDPNADLSWAAGFGARMHYVYFGDNFDDVNSATGGVQQGSETYDPGPLELEKTYYWRVDESDGVTMQTGDVWSFMTAGTGGGVKGQYYHHSGVTPPIPASLAFGTLVLTRTDPQINFQWGNGSPDPSINVEDFSARWTGEVEAVFTETYTFYTNTDDGVKLWVNGQLIINNWTDHGTTENRGTIDLVGERTYPIEMWFYERGGGAVAELRWESPRTPKDLIPQAALSLPVKAKNPNPLDGAADVKQTVILSWSPGDEAASHQLYFGTDEDAVRNADTASPEYYKGTRNLGSESYDPGKLPWDTTYYWRIDEVNNLDPNSPWVGNVWNFTTADFLIVDDIESYNDLDPNDPGSNRIYDTWIDGWEIQTNGSTIGYSDPDFGAGEHFVETNIVHGGRQSMPYFYENNFKYSEASMTLVYPTDWTEKDVNTLTIWFRGGASNAIESMYVALNGIATVYHDDPNAAQIDTWTEWTIDLQAFADQGVDLTNVNTLAIGFGDKNNLQAGGSGKVYFDDIRLYQPGISEVYPITITIDNPGFEDPVLGEDDWTWLDVPGWTWVGGEGPGIWHVTNADFDPVVAPEGQNVLYTENAVGDAGGVAQVLTETFAANTDYTLTAEVGNSWEYYYAGYSVQLLAGGTVIAEDNNTLWPDYMLWDTSTVEYTYDPADAALVGQPLEIRLLNLGIDMDVAAPSVVGVEFDNVTLSYVPEPAG